MYSLLFLAVSSFTLSLVLTPLSRNLFRRWELVDRPDNSRKLHSKPIPRVGGIPIAISVGLSYALLFLFPLQGGTLILQQLPFIWRLCPAGGLIFITGLLDDLIDLKPWQKLLGQCSAALLAVLSGLRVSNVLGYSFDSWWVLLATTLWILVCTNAFNLIDGLDGLAAGLGFLATVTILIAGLFNDNVTLALATVPLASALLAFLRYNFNRATIFLGDSGSMLIGFLLGCFGVIWSQKAVTLLGMTAPIMVLGIPLLDVCLSIARRFLRNESIFAADRGHIHHKLLDRGFSPRRVVLTLYIASGIFASLALIANVFRGEYIGIVVVFFCAAAWIGIRKLNYIEFDLFRRMVKGATLQRLLKAQIRLRQFSESMASAISVDERWGIITQVATEFRINHVQYYYQSVMFECQLGNADPNNCWSLRIPLSSYDYIQLTREFSSSETMASTDLLIDMLRRSLQAPLKEQTESLQAVSCT